MTNEIVKQDVWEVQEVYGYAELREPPLPEVKQEPYGWRLQGIGSMPNFTTYSFHDMIYWKNGAGLKVTELYRLPPDAAALRKENEQLREEIQKSFNTGLRQGLIAGADFARELYVNHCFHHGVNGLLLRCEEAEGKLYKMADEALKGGAA